MTKRIRATNAMNDCWMGKPRMINGIKAARIKKNITTPMET
jgi:hypothetical protein